MNFKLRAMDADAQDQQMPMHHSQPSSTFSFFTEPAIPGFLNENFAGGRVGKDMFERFEMRESIRRELEKERIRAEIIAAEMARKRILEAEVRNELMMERQMAMTNAGEVSSPFMSQSVPAIHKNLFLPEILHRQSIKPEEKQIMSIDENYSVGGRLREIRGFPVSPLRLLGDSLKIKGIPTPEDNQKEVIYLIKPDDETLSGTKRKSAPEVSEGSSQNGLDRSKKKVKEEWSCAVCQVSATNERGLKEHLQGKKHRNKEAALVAQRTGANFGLGVAPKNLIIKPNQLALTTVSVSSSGEAKSVTRKISVDQTQETSKPSCDQNDVKKEAKMVKNNRDRFKFWCEMCQVGAFTEIVMNDHKEGKKHSNLVERYRKGKVGSEASATADTFEDGPKSKTNQAVAVEMVAAEVKPQVKPEVTR